MTSNNGNDWLSTVAAKAGVETKTVEAVLAARRIQPSPVVASPRRLLLKRIAFSGTKSAVTDSGPFDFQWGNLGRGLWGMVTDDNLRGKSSVINVVRWLMRGRQGSLRDDVRKWIERASLQFQLDDIDYEIKAETVNEPKGTLVRFDNPVNRELARFSSDAEFESVMADFFMREFSLDVVPNWHEGSKEAPGKSVLHSWPALSGVMFIGTDYTSLLGDMGANTGVPLRLMQMYLGLPWISTLATAKAVQKSVASEYVARMQQRTTAAAGRKSRVDEIKIEFDAKKRELEQTPSDAEVRACLAGLKKEFEEAGVKEHALVEQLKRESEAVSQAESAHAEDRHDLRAHLDAETAGAVFRMLDPSCCPRCDAEIGDDRRSKEKATHTCSVCGEGITSNSDAEAIGNDLKARVAASKAGIDKAKRAKERVSLSLDQLRERIRALDAEIQSVTVKLASFEVRRGLELQIAALEARLVEANFDPTPKEAKYQETDEPIILEALVNETETRVKDVQTGILKAVSAQLVQYAQRFGMRNLTEADLKGNMNLSLVTGGQPTSYSKVTDGEKLRLKVAAVLAMIRVAEENGIGRHPGLLIIDSPGAQEVSPKDLGELIAGLEEVSKDFVHLQVFIAALASPAITAHVPSERLLHASGSAALW